jgi:hypothetical protein
LVAILFSYLMVSLFPKVPLLSGGLGGFGPFSAPTKTRACHVDYRNYDFELKLSSVNDFEGIHSHRMVS